MAAKQAKQFLSVEEHEGGNKLRLHEEVVRSLLLSEDVADKPVVVTSVAGAFRTGKSFLLNSMSRYLMASDKSRWLDNKSESFDWKGGCDAHTNGMFMSHPIPVTLPSGEEAVLLLMDSQGIFDSNSTTTDSTKIFALSTLLSSVQVYNVMNNLKKDDLDNLQLFAEYGRMAMDNAEAKPFQDLVFLIRDWCYADDHPFGSQGGNDFVKKRLSSNKESLAQEREHIKACFTDVSGFLLPHPGAVVAGSRKFAGDAEDMDPAFSRALEELVSTLLSPEKLSVKMNGNRPMTCRQLATHIKTYTDLFRSGKLPELKSILQAVAEAGKMAAVDHELLTYERRMEGLLGRDAPMLDESRLYGEHEQAKTEALTAWKLRRTMGDPTREDNYYQELLVEKIEDWFKEEHNKKLDRDIPKAKNANQIIVDECIEVVHQRTKKSPPSLQRFVPRSEATIHDAHEEAKQEALTLFNEKKVTVGSYDAEESRLRLEQSLEIYLRKLESDILEAKTANQKLVGECIESAKKYTDQPRFLPRTKATITGEHNEISQRERNRFEADKVTVGLYEAEESRLRLEEALDLYLRMALEKNAMVLLAWEMAGGTIVGVGFSLKKYGF